jgi:hypothetical protein
LGIGGTAQNDNDKVLISQKRNWKNIDLSSDMVLKID